MPPDVTRDSLTLLELDQLGHTLFEARGLPSLATVLVGSLKKALQVRSAELLIWDRKLAVFETLSRGGTRLRALRPEPPKGAAPKARYLISGGELLTTALTRGATTLLPLLARSGLVGMVVLGPRPSRKGRPYTQKEVRSLEEVASRAALAIESRLYEAELVENERLAALGTFASMLAHDFRGPMTVIRGYAETLIEEDPPPAPQIVASRAALIVEMVDRLERMTHETLDFAKGGGRLVVRRTSASDLLDGLLDAARKQLPKLPIVEDRGGVPEGTTLAADLDKLRRVFLNLAGNAAEAMKGTGRLFVTARVEGGREGDHLVLELKDEGQGVPDAIREHLFEPFVTHGKAGGTGLGLALTRRFVEDHKGTIELLDARPGATFRIRLPCGRMGGKEAV
jgi:signal transduction histidine kinase